MEVCKKENVSYSEDGLSAVVFTSQGDMRQALNNLQSTYNGFRHVNEENVFKVCDEPHPLLVKQMLEHCTRGDIRSSYLVYLIIVISLLPCRYYCIFSYFLDYG